MADLGAYHHARGRQEQQPPGSLLSRPSGSQGSRPGVSPGTPSLAAPPAAGAPRLGSSPHRLLPSLNAPAPDRPQHHLTNPNPHLSPNILPPLRSLDRTGPPFHPEPPPRASPAVFAPPAASQRVPFTPHPFHHPLTMSSPTAPAGYYPPPGQASLQQVGAPTDPNQPPLRYPLPVADNRNLHGRSGKKEIKRRTKTGCMTCRRRRIKVSNDNPARPITSSSRPRPRKHRDHIALHQAEKL